MTPSIEPVFTLMLKCSSVLYTLTITKLFTYFYIIFATDSSMLKLPLIICRTRTGYLRDITIDSL